MKKYFAVVGMLVAGIVAGAPVLAATSVKLTPAAVKTNAGQVFTVPVVVDPQGVKNYTVKVMLNYPADLLEVRSFTFSSRWMPVTQSGYDLVDNSNGILIKTAGYPQGFSANAQLGTVTFRAKKAGTGTVSLAEGTTALDQANQNVFAGSSQVNVSVAALVTASPVPAASVSPVPAAAQVSPSVSPSEEPSPSTGLEAAIQSENQQASLLGAVGDSLKLGTGSAWVMALVLLAIAGALFYLIRRLRRKA